MCRDRADMHAPCLGLGRARVHTRPNAGLLVSIVSLPGAAARANERMGVRTPALLSETYRCQGCSGRCTTKNREGMSGPAGPVFLQGRPCVLSLPPAALLPSCTLHPAPCVCSRSHARRGRTLGGHEHSAELAEQIERSAEL